MMNIKHFILIPALILPAQAEIITMGEEKLPKELWKPAYRALQSDGGYFWGERTSARVIKRGNALMLMDGNYCLLEANIFPYMKKNSLLVAVLFRVDGKKFTRIDIVDTLTTPEDRFQFSLVEGALRIKSTDGKRDVSIPLEPNAK